MVTMQRNTSKNAVSIEKKLNSGMDQRGNQLREEFSRQFLHGMSDRIQSDFGPKQLERFLNNKLENNKLELRNCFSKLGNEFETGLNNYQKLLDEIQGGPTVNLNNLTVLLSRLDFLEKIKTPAN